MLAAIIHDCPTKLADLLTSSFTEDKIADTESSPIEGLPRGMFQKNPTRIVTSVKIDENGQVNFPNKIFKEQPTPDANVVYYDAQQEYAVAQALMVLLPSLETMFNRSFRNMSHDIIISCQVVYANEHIHSGPWHHDGGALESGPETSIIYFNHVNTKSKLSVKQDSIWDDLDENRPSLYTIETSKPCMISFDNLLLSHRVHDVYAIDPNQPAYRHVLIFFYCGPFEECEISNILTESIDSYSLTIQDNRKNQPETKTDKALLTLRPSQVLGTMYSNKISPSFPNPTIADKIPNEINAAPRVILSRSKSF